MTTNLSNAGQEILEDLSKKLKNMEDDPATQAIDILMLIISLYQLIRSYIKKWF